MPKNANELAIKLLTVDGPVTVDPEEVTQDGWPITSDGSVEVP